MNRELQKKLKDLRKDLRGYYDVIAKSCKVSKSTVSYVLQGKYENDKVMETALDVRKKAMKERAAKIKALEAKL